MTTPEQKSAERIAEIERAVNDPNLHLWDGARSVIIELLQMNTNLVDAIEGGLTLDAVEYASIEKANAQLHERVKELEKQVEGITNGSFDAIEVMAKENLGLRQANTELIAALEVAIEKLDRLKAKVPSFDITDLRSILEQHKAKV